MLIFWHASAGKMLQSSWFNKPLDQLLTLRVLKHRSFVFSCLLGLISGLGYTVLVGIRCQGSLQVVKLSTLRPSRI